MIVGFITMEMRATKGLWLVLLLLKSFQVAFHCLCLHITNILENAITNLDLNLNIPQFNYGGKKSNKNQWPKPSHGRQKGKAKERPKNVQLVGTKEGRKLVLIVVGNYLTHHPFNVTRMQIMKPNSNRRFRTNISC
jgi:hypothetical protein